MTAEKGPVLSLHTLVHVLRLAHHPFPYRAPLDIGVSPGAAWSHWFLSRWFINWPLSTPQSSHKQRLCFISAAVWPGTLRAATQWVLNKY